MKNTKEKRIEKNTNLQTWCKSGSTSAFQENRVSVKAEGSGSNPDVCIKEKDDALVRDLVFRR